jgi:mRNA-degrading endonuclease HigB of HigAB toxin-antitoxin module
MHIITRKRLNEFVAKHPNAKPGLTHWYRTRKPATPHPLASLMEVISVLVEKYEDEHVPELS